MPEQPTVQIALTYDELKTLQQSHSLAEERALEIGPRIGETEELTKRRRKEVGDKLDLARRYFDHVHAASEVARRLKGVER
jgi:hypothetical protein